MVSALRVRGRNPALEAWAVSVALSGAQVLLASTTAAEVERGVASGSGPTPNKERCSAAGSGAGAASIRGPHRAYRSGGGTRPGDLPSSRASPLDDALIAAVAQANKFVVATRNTKHLEPLRVRLLNPCV